MPKGVASADKVDGRSLRATGRNKQFATRVTEEWHDQVKTIAARDGLMLVEVLERAVDAYEVEHGGGQFMARLELLLTQATPAQREQARAIIKKLDGEG